MALGIDFFETASHGGFRLSPDRLEQMPKALRKRPGTHRITTNPIGHGRPGYPDETFCGPEWFEEDAEASLVILAFPDAFSPAEVENARRAVESWYPVAHAEWLAR